MRDIHYFSFWEIMMKKFFCILLASMLTFSLVACGNNESAKTLTISESSEKTNEPFTISTEPIVDISVSSVSVKESVPEEPEEVEEIPEDMYRSELTNELIPIEIQNQRPVAIMVDNEKVALPHYGTSTADVVYELMNSTLNGRITRFMCIVKDWKNIERFGNLRSTRSTNVILAPEYNAILVHDGGPYYIDEWFGYKNATNHLSGGFARFSNGKNWEYREYVTSENYTNPDSGDSYAGLIKRIEKAKYDTEYNDYYMGPHFSFANKEFTLEGTDESLKCDTLELPYPHNKSMLKYNEENGTYDFYEYGEIYVDALNDNNLSFKNLIVLNCDFVQLDEHGYMCYYAIGSGNGYYITNGYAIPIKYSKKDMFSITEFTNAQTGEALELNTGKIYITYVPKDSWGDLVIE